MRGNTPPGSRIELRGLLQFQDLDAATCVWRSAGRMPSTAVQASEERVTEAGRPPPKFHRNGASKIYYPRGVSGRVRLGLARGVWLPIRSAVGNGPDQAVESVTITGEWKLKRRDEWRE